MLVRHFFVWCCTMMMMIYCRPLVCVREIFVIACIRGYRTGKRLCMWFAMVRARGVGE